MPGAELLMACFGPQGIIETSKPLLPFLGAAFLLMLGFGRLLPVFARLLRGEGGDGQAGASFRVPWSEATTTGRRLATLTNLVAYLYIPAALFVGVGLAGGMILGRTEPLLVTLDIIGIALGLVTTVLLLVCNWAARAPAMEDQFVRVMHDGPAQHVNQALRNRGTSRFEIVLVTVIAMGFAANQVLSPAGDAPMVASVASYELAALQDCPEADELGAGYAGAPQAPPRLPLNRLPGRSNGAAHVAVRQNGETPALRLDATPLESFASLEPLAPVPPETPPSAWARMASLAFTMPRRSVEPLSPPDAPPDRPVLRPAFPQHAEVQSPSVPPPALFGTVAQQTRMAPDYWQIRVSAGLDDFGRCLAERVMCDENAELWTEFVESARGLEGLDLYLAVNRFVNEAVRFQPDSSLAAVLDDWITPASLVNGAEGDCEDFALAKFWLLELLGVDRNDLYIVVVQDVTARLPHAYLAVRSGPEVWLLDSRINRPLSPHELDGIVPVVTIGHAAAYLHGRPIDPGTPMSFLWDWLNYS